MLFLALIATASAACKQLVCEDFKNQYKCNDLRTCAWDIMGCFTLKENVDCSSFGEQTCYNYSTQCVWDWHDNECLRPVKLGCSTFKTYQACKDSGSVRNGENSCDWRHGSCVGVNTCQQTQNVHMCRNNRLLYDRCFTVIRGKQYEEHYRSDQSILSIFDDVKCVSQDCYNRDNCDYGYFTNGRRCFSSPIGGCNNCQNFLSPQSCVGTGNCYWGESKCLDIKCSDLKSQTTCAAQKYCKWNVTSCDYYKPEFAHCFSRAKDFKASGQDQTVRVDL